MFRKIILGIFFIVFYFIFRDVFRAKEKTYEILGSPEKKNRLARKKTVVEVDFVEQKPGKSHESKGNPEVKRGK
jgi:hypothetical protein